MWKWIWPLVGPTPISQGLDTEMFDRVDYPYSETFVREAIQNSLDARLDQTEPVVISFSFHRKTVAERRAFLQQAIDYRKKVGLPSPSEWERDTIDWLTIEDFNAKGLGGDLKSRVSDFWNYWLNFGVSNKDGSGRGGRGIGRVTFLIASRIHTVVGLTRRSRDGRTEACGMCVLRAIEDHEGFHSTHAYLASEVDGSIYQTHRTPEFYRELETAFGLTGYQQAPYKSGLALAIPYPHPELNADGILASAFEHFAPAILGGSLVVRVDGQQLDAATIDETAERVAPRVRAQAIGQDTGRYLALIRRGLANDLTDISVPDLKLASQRDAAPTKELQAAAERGEPVAVRILIPLQRRGRTTTVGLKAVIARTPYGKLAVDRLYREGMSLPDVKAKNPAELDVIILVEDEELATYLNFCEGKAHLDLLESKETKSKLEENGFGSGFRVKRFVKGLPVELRNFLTPDITEPDANVFDSFFAIPDDRSDKQGGKGPRPDRPPPPPPPLPVPKTPAFIVETLKDGFRVRANPKYAAWPVNISVAIAYADGTRNPAWSEYDFRPSDLKTIDEGCGEISFTKNKLQALDCGPDCSIEVAGFDARRELDTRIRVWKNAQAG